MKKNYMKEKIYSVNNGLGINEFKKMKYIFLGLMMTILICTIAYLFQIGISQLLSELKVFENGFDFFYLFPEEYFITIQQYYFSITLFCLYMIINSTFLKDHFIFCECSCLITAYTCNSS